MYNVNMVTRRENDYWTFAAYGPAQNIRMIAAAAHLSVRRLAKSMWIQPSTLYNILNGKTDLIHNDTADVLARNFLYYTTGDVPGEHEYIKEVADTIRYGEEPCYYEAHTLSMWLRYSMASMDLSATDFNVSNKTIYNILDGSHKANRWTIRIICETTGDNPRDVYKTYYDKDTKSWR